jgi:hypothetical protein
MAPEDPILLRCEIHLVATPRPRHWFARFVPPATRAELWGGLGFLLVSVIGAIWVIKCRSDALAFERDNVTVEGTVVRKWVSVGKGSTKYVDYQFMADSDGEAPRTIRGETRVDAAYFARLKPGAPVSIKMCRTDPANHEVVGGKGHVFSSTAAMLVCLGVLALLAFAGAVNLWWWWVCRRLTRRTQIVVADARGAS